MPTRKEPAELFHSYLVDSRKSPIDKSKITTFENQKSTDLRLFSADLEDARRTNMEAACCVPGDDTFLVTGFKLEAKFSSSAVVADFIRSTRFTIIIGDKPMYTMEANVLADPMIAYGFALPGGVTQAPDDLNTDLTAKQELLRRIVIPPRQCIEVVMSTSGIVAERFKRIEAGTEQAFVEVRFSLCGEKVIQVEDEPDYYPNKNGMQLTPTIPETYDTEPSAVADTAPLANCVQESPYRGHGEPPEEPSPLDKFSTVLMFHLKRLNPKEDRDQWSPEIVRQALRNTMDSLPEYKDNHEFFTIPPEDDGFDTELAYGAPFSKDEKMSDVEAKFFDADTKTWSPADYLQKKKP